MVRLLLVRHGESEWNEEERIQGQQDVPISDRGRQQAFALGQQLRGVPLVACFASPLSRAMETAQLVLMAAEQSVPITPMPALMERQFGTWEGKLLADVQREDAFAQWVAANYIPAPPGGESLTELFVRVEAGLREILTAVPSSNVLVVGHSGSIKAAICVLFRLPLTSFARLIVGNANLSIVEVRNGRARLVRHGPIESVADFPL